MLFSNWFPYIAFPLSQSQPWEGLNMAKGLGLKECHRILDVPEGASLREIRKSFLKLAKVYHPDRNPHNPDSEERFKLMASAFEFLEKYYQKHMPIAVPAPDFTFDPEFDLRKYRANDYSDKCEDNFDASVEFPNLLVRLKKSFLGFLRLMERKVLVIDLDINILISKSTAEKGGVIRIKTGKKPIRIKIPKNAQEGMVLKVPGRGERGFFSRKRGDLYLKIRISPENV